MNDILSLLQSEQDAVLFLVIVAVFCTFPFVLQLLDRFYSQE